MTDPNYMAVPPGWYWEPDDDRIDHARIEDEARSLADRVVDAAIEEALIARARRRDARLYQATY